MNQPSLDTRRPRAPGVLALLLAPALLEACSGGGGPSPTAHDAGLTTDSVARGDSGLPRVALADPMNYAFRSTLAAVTTPVRANGDLTFDWSNATVDMLGRTLDPLGDVDMLQLMLWRYDQASFLAGVNRESLDTGRMVAMAYCNPRHARTECGFADLMAPAGSPIAREKLLAYLDPAVYPPSEHVWVVMLATGGVFGRGTRLLAFLEPRLDEANDRVQLDQSSTTLSYTVDLAHLEPIALPPLTGDVVLDWSDTERLTRNAMGDVWIPTHITDVTIARYVGFAVADLERQFLLLRDLATEQYTARLNAGQEIALARLTNGAGNSFPGIDEADLWLVSLSCGACRNPAPWFLSFLQPLTAQPSRAH